MKIDREPTSVFPIGTARFFAEDVAVSPPIVEGSMKVPETPGLGVSVEEWWQDQPAIPQI